MKKRNLLALLLGGVIIANAFPPIPVDAANNAEYMEKTLESFKEENYDAAEKYAKKMTRYANESCVKNMSSAMKKAYKKTVKSYEKKYGTEWSIDNENPVLWGYFLTDVTGDNKAELIVEYGLAEADVRMTIYRYKNGKAKKIGTEYCGHTAFFAYPKHEGFVVQNAHMGGEALTVLRVSDNGKFVYDRYGDRYVEPPKEYIDLGCRLRNNMNYTKDYTPSVDYGALE